MRDPGVRVPSTGKPSHIMVGFDRPGGGVRLYASRSVHDTGWASRNTGLAANVWHLDADMDHTLIIDGKTWGEVYARVFEIWENHDREAALQEGKRKRIEAANKALEAAGATRMTGTGPSPYHYASDGSQHRGAKSSECELCTRTVIKGTVDAEVEEVTE